MVRAVAVAIALSLFPLSATAAKPGEHVPVTAAASAGHGVGAGGLWLRECMNPAPSHFCCGEPTVGVQSLGPVRLRDADEHPALTVRLVVVPAQAHPAQSASPPARDPGPVFSRFIFFGNFRS
ncbi:MAG: hypothetical protein HY323_18265 [Betaproteobacteria bacterium]|nr:hypothetical protein [Betaproteobacteria bacterium]